MKNIETNAICPADEIKHTGIVKNADEKFYYVSVINQSACEACHSKSVCNIGMIKEEIIEIPKTGGDNYTVGDKVEVKMEKTLGTKAVLLGYVYPFLILLITLIVSNIVLKNEGLAALIALVILIPYYLLLYIKRDVLKKTFLFKLS